MLKVLVVAQTPPPFHGQSIMTQYFLEGQYDRVELQHVRMAFSADIDQVGRAGLGKVLHLFLLTARVIATRLRQKSDVLYFPPAGPNMVPFLRDAFLLIATRWMFSRTVFHFHAAGLPGLFHRLPFPLKFLFRLAYNRPDVAITISQDGWKDAEFLDARRIAFVPNGIPDVPTARKTPESHSPPTILFLAMVCEEKGAAVLIEACHILHARGVAFRCLIAGRAASDRELTALQTLSADLGDRVQFTGPLTGEGKWKTFSEGDVFCFPTFYASESFGLVVVEAMMAGLPVVASNWRALPEIVVEGETGFLTPVRDPLATADRLEKLLKNAALRQSMGQAGRTRFEAHYTVEIFRSKMEAALLGEDCAKC